MSRPTLLIGSRYNSVAEALHQLTDLFLPNGELVHSVKHVGFVCAAELFEALDDLPPQKLLNTIVVLDLGAEDETVWNVTQMKGERGLATRLVLAFPEVYFIFVGASGSLKSPARYSGMLSELGLSSAEQDATWTLLKEHHFNSGRNLLRIFALVQLHAQGFRTLFDPTGLRSLIKFGLQQELLGKLPDVRASLYRHYSVSRLQNVAAIAEEEAAFLYLNGYATYKFGFRSWLAQTNKEFSRLTQDQDPPPFINAQSTFAVSIMDWHLAYRDDEETSEAKRQPLREAFLSNRVSSPIIVTSFPHAFYQKESRIQRLKKRIKQWLNSEAVEVEEPVAAYEWKSKAVILPKPYGGFFDLIHKPVENGSENPCNVVFKNVWQKMADDIHQPVQSQKARDTPTPHSAPHACSAVAERLLLRAQELRAGDPVRTETWIHAALLAGEAKEILGGLSLTTTFQTLALQNEAEVSSEVSFFGMSVDVNVERRLDLLDEEVVLLQQAATSGRFKERREDVSGRLNCLLLTAHSLRMRFSRSEQMDASEVCLRRFSKYQRKLHRLPSSFEITRYPRAAWNWFTSLPGSYPEFATNAGTSVKRLLALSVFWVVFFSIGYLILFSLHPSLEGKIGKSSVLALGHSFFTFLQLQPGLSEAEDLKGEGKFGLEQIAPSDPAFRHIRTWHMKWVLAYWILLLTELVFAYIHLGLLVSVLYRRITKRAP